METVQDMCYVLFIFMIQTSSAAEKATVKIDAKFTDQITASLSVNVNGDLPTTDEYYINIAEYTEGQKICIHVMLNEAHNQPIIFAFSYNAFSGTPSHAYTDAGGLNYVSYLQTFAVAEKNVSGSFTIPEGTTDFVYKTDDMGGIYHYKRMVCNAVQGYPKDRTVIQIHVTDYTYNSDNFLTTSSGGGSGSGQHVAQCLGTISYAFTDYGSSKNQINSSNWNRTAYLKIYNESFPVVDEAYATIELVKRNTKTVLETKTINLSKLYTLIEFYNVSDRDEGYTYDVVGDTYYRLKSYSMKRNNGDYYLLIFQ